MGKKRDSREQVLHVIRKGDVTSARILLSVHPKCCSEPLDAEGHAFIHFACMENRLDLVQYLVEEMHVDPLQSDKELQPPIAYAAVFRNREIVDYLSPLGSYSNVFIKVRRSLVKLSKEEVTLRLNSVGALKAELGIDLFSMVLMYKSDWISAVKTLKVYNGCRDFDKAAVKYALQKGFLSTIESKTALLEWSIVHTSVDSFQALLRILPLELIESVLLSTVMSRERNWMPLVLPNASIFSDAFLLQVFSWLINYGIKKRYYSVNISISRLDSLLYKCLVSPADQARYSPLKKPLAETFTLTSRKSLAFNALKSAQVFSLKEDYEQDLLSSLQQCKSIEDWEYILSLEDRGLLPNAPLSLKGQKVNVFFAALSNVRCVRFLLDHYKDYSPVFEWPVSLVPKLTATDLVALFACLKTHFKQVFQLFVQEHMDRFLALALKMDCSVLCEMQTLANVWDWVHLHPKLIGNRSVRMFLKAEKWARRMSLLFVYQRYPVLKTVPQSLVRDIIEYLC